MSYLNVTKDNIAPGMKIYENDNELYVYKINAKSVWAGPKSWDAIKGLWEERTKGTKWTDLMNKHNGNKYTYDNLKVNEEEVAKKNSFIKKEEKQNNDKNFITQIEKRDLKKAYNQFLKGKSYKYLIEVGNNRLHIIVASKDEYILFKKNNNMIIWDMKENLFYPFKENEHKKDKEILWPERYVEDQAS